MTRYLLDTNVVSELRRARPHGAVRAWIEKLRAEQIHISAVTVGDLQAGVERTRRTDAAKAAEIEAWIDQLPEAFEILPMDLRCFREWARLMEGKPEQILEDAMIAATARVHSLTVATRNDRDFRALQVELFNPFRAQ